MLGLKPSIWPPLLALVVSVHGLCEELIPVTLKRRNVDHGGDDRPEAPAACLIPQVDALVGGADERALPWLDHFLAAVAWAIALCSAGDECFELRHFGPAHG